MSNELIKMAIYNIVQEKNGDIVFMGLFIGYISNDGRYEISFGIKYFKAVKKKKIIRWEEINCSYK